MSSHIRFAAMFGSMVLLACPPSGSTMTDAQRATIEEAVAKAHAETVRYAEQLDVDKAISTMLENDKGAFTRDGELIMTRQEVVDVYTQIYAGLQSQDIHIGRQNVIALSPDIALLVGEGKSASTTKDGRTFSARWAETVVYVRVDDEWKVFHAHQSVPRVR